MADAGHRRPRPRFDATFVGIRSGVVEIPLAVLGADAALAVSMLFRYSMGVAAVPYCSSPLVTMRIHVPGGPWWTQPSLLFSGWTSPTITSTTATTMLISVIVLMLPSREPLGAGRDATATTRGIGLRAMRRGCVRPLTVRDDDIPFGVVDDQPLVGWYDNDAFPI